MGLWLMGAIIGWFQTWRNFESVKAVSVMILMTLGGYLSALGKQPKAVIDASRTWRSVFKTIFDFFADFFSGTARLMVSEQPPKVLNEHILMKKVLIL
jgi:hypothetical protein